MDKKIIINGLLICLNITLYILYGHICLYIIHIFIHTHISLCIYCFKTNDDKDLFIPLFFILKAQKSHSEVFSRTHYMELWKTAFRGPFSAVRETQAKNRTCNKVLKIVVRNQSCEDGITVMIQLSIWTDLIVLEEH